MRNWFEIIEILGDTPETREDVLEACLAQCKEDQALFFSAETLALLAYVQKGYSKLWLSHVFPLIQFWPKEEKQRFQQLLEENSLATSPENGRETPQKDAGNASQDGDLTSTSYSDVFNGEALVKRHGEVLRYCKEWASWYIWKDTHWHKDRDSEVYDYARETVREFGKTGFDTDNSKLIKHAIKSRSDNALASMLHQAGTMGIRTVPEAYDRFLWHLNCPNGTLDLKTGALLDHDSKALITKCTATTYNPEADCPLWLAFLRQIMQSSPDSSEDTAADLERKDAYTDDLLSFLQRAVGYSLVGEVQEKILLIPWGTGDNGKSTFIETVAAVLGPDYAMRTPTEIFMSRRDGTIPNDVAQLKGIRFAYAVEPPQDRRLGESMIKELTGGDTVSARFMRGEFFQFQPECTLWMATNHRPPTRGTDNALWNRIKLIPFNVAIPKESQDKELKNKLIGEREGILAWAVKGCLDWQRNGLQEPDAVKAATADYRAENDVVGAFIQEKCLVGPNYRGKASILYAAYKQYAEESGERSMSQKAFSMALIEKDYEKHEDRGIWYLGVAVNDN